ncbi:hypothetical protein PR048_017151 [Dryococelus australis]|uniref:Uncharacterized protein n=1 Tax=Dryococelus australis TaxID=614101 RepID=A0ABQ9H8Q6_9NEOP|nr:hypothetical protein PR048_017151 [Dryococelus australis]
MCIPKYVVQNAGDHREYGSRFEIVSDLARQVQNVNIYSKRDSPSLLSLHNDHCCQQAERCSLEVFLRQLREHFNTNIDSNETKLRALAIRREFPLAAVPPVGVDTYRRKKKPWDFIGRALAAWKTLRRRGEELPTMGNILRNTRYAASTYELHVMPDTNKSYCRDRALKVVHDKVSTFDVNLLNGRTDIQTKTFHSPLIDDRPVFSRLLRRYADGEEASRLINPREVCSDRDEGGMSQACGRNHETNQRPSEDVVQRLRDSQGREKDLMQTETAVIKFLRAVKICTRVLEETKYRKELQEQSLRGKTIFAASPEANYKDTQLGRWSAGRTQKKSDVTAFTMSSPHQFARPLSKFLGAWVIRTWFTPRASDSRYADTTLVSHRCDIVSIQVGSELFPNNNNSHNCLRADSCSRSRGSFRPSLWKKCHRGIQAWMFLRQQGHTRLSKLLRDTRTGRKSAMRCMKGRSQYLPGVSSKTVENRNVDVGTGNRTRVLPNAPPRLFSTLLGVTSPLGIFGRTRFILEATVAERQACSPPTKVDRAQSPAGSLRIFACGNRAGRCRWSVGFLGDLRFPCPFIPGCCSILSTITLIGSQDLNVKSRRNNFTHECLLRLLCTRICFARLRLTSEGAIRGDRTYTRHHENTARQFGALALSGDDALAARSSVALSPPRFSASNMGNRSRFAGELSQVYCSWFTFRATTVQTARTGAGGKCVLYRDRSPTSYHASITSTRISHTFGIAHQTTLIIDNYCDLSETESPPVNAELLQFAFLLLKAVHENVSTFEINLKKKSLLLPAYTLTGALSDIRPRPAHPEMFPAFGAQKFWSNKDETATFIKDHIAATLKALNWSAVFSCCEYLGIEENFASSMTCWLDSTVLGALEPQMFVHWLLLQRVASVTPHLAVWHSPRVSLQVCYWLKSSRACLMYCDPIAKLKLSEATTITNFARVLAGFKNSGSYLQHEEMRAFKDPEAVEGRRRGRRRTEVAGGKHPNLAASVEDENAQGLIRRKAVWREQRNTFA